MVKLRRGYGQNSGYHYRTSADAVLSTGVEHRATKCNAMVGRWSEAGWAGGRRQEAGGRIGGGWRRWWGLRTEEVGPNPRWCPEGRRTYRP